MTAFDPNTLSARSIEPTPSPALPVWPIARPAGRVLLVDTHPGFLAHLRQILEDDPRLEVVGEARSGIEALRLIEVQRPDLVIIDPEVFGLPGSEVATALRRLWPEIGIIFRALQIDPELEVVAAAGGADCLGKDAPVATLVATVHAQLRRARTGQASGEAMLAALLEREPPHSSA